MPAIEINPHELKCPTCGAPEVHPETGKLLIRAYKIDNWSQCLVCSGYYSNDWREMPDRHDSKKGWFPPK